METKINQSSSDYAIRCAETIVADKNITEETILIMFMEYKKILFKEIREQTLNGK